MKDFKRFMVLSVLATGIALNGIPVVSNNVASLSSVHAEEITVVDSGSFQKGITYQLYSDNVLHIKAEGNDVVWESGTVVEKLGKDVAAQIKQVVFDTTITVSSMDGTFKDMTSLESINTNMLYSDTRDADGKFKDEEGTIGISAGAHLHETFMNCKKLRKLDLSGIDPQIMVGSMSESSSYRYDFDATIFVGCDALEELKINDYSQYSNMSDRMCFDMAVTASKLKYDSYSDNYLKGASVYCYTVGKTAKADYPLHGRSSSLLYASDNSSQYDPFETTCGNCYPYMWTFEGSGTKTATYKWVPRSFNISYSTILHHKADANGITISASANETQNVTLFTGVQELNNSKDEISNLGLPEKLYLVGYISVEDVATLSGLEDNTKYPQSKEYYEALKKAFITTVDTDTFECKYSSKMRAGNAFEPIVSDYQLYAVYETKEVVDEYFTEKEEKTFTISFEPGPALNSEIFSPIAVKEGEALKNLPIPIYEGKAYFSGWNDKNGNPIEDGFIPTSDMVLYGSALCPAATLEPGIKDADNLKKDNTTKTDSNTSVNTQEGSNINTPANNTVSNTVNNATKEVTEQVVTSLDTVKGFKVSSKKKKTTFTWKKVTNAKKYQLQISKNKKMKKGLKTFTVSDVKKVVKLKNGTYYVRIRAVCDNVNSKWSKTKKIKAK